MTDKLLIVGGMVNPPTKPLPSLYFSRVHLPSRLIKTNKTQLNLTNVATSTVTDKLATTLVETSDKTKVHDTQQFAGTSQTSLSFGHGVVKTKKMLKYPNKRKSQLSSDEDEFSFDNDPIVTFSDDSTN